MARVLVELEKCDNTTELAVASLSKIFSRCKIESRFLYLNQIDQKELEWCDSYLAVRPSTPISVRIARSIVESGRFYSVMFDDDLINHKGALWWRATCSKKSLALADLVIGVNPVLTKEYAALAKSKRGVVFNTPVDIDEFVEPHQFGKKIRFVYAAGRDHAHIFEKQLKPVVHSFLNEYSDKAHFTFIGVEPDLSGVGHEECFTFVPLMPLNKYNDYMRENSFDVGLAPLGDDSFSSKKYFNKFIEYSKVGITGMYSNCLPFTLVVVDRMNGLLVNNTESDWKAALELVMADKTLIEKCAIYAQQNLKEDFSLKEISSIISKSIPEFECYNCNSEIKWRKPKTIMACFKLMDKTKKFIYQITHMGLRSTAKLICNYIRDHR